MVFLFIDGDYLLTGVNPESLHDVQLTIIDILKAIRTQLLNYPTTEVNVDKDSANNANSKEEKHQKDKTRSNVTSNISSDGDTELLLSLASGLVEARIIYFSSAVMQQIAEHTRVAFISALRHWRFQVHVLESVESRIGSPVDAAMCTRIVQTCYTFQNELLPFVYPHSTTTTTTNTNNNMMLDMNVVSAESAGFHHSAGNTHTNMTGNNNNNNNNNNNPIASTEGNYLNLHKLFCIFANNTLLSSACDVALSLNFDMTLIHYNTDGVAEELLSFLSPKYANGNGKASIAKRKLENGDGVVVLHHTAAAIEALEALPIIFPNMSLDLQMKIKQMKDLLLSQRQNIVHKTNYNANNPSQKPINIVANNKDNNNNVSGLITSNTIPTRAITDAPPASSDVNTKKETNNNNNNNKSNNNDMKDNITEENNKSVNNSISASQVQKRALFPFTSPPPPLPGLPDPFSSDNYIMTSNNINNISNNNSNQISNRITDKTQDTLDSDDDEEGKVVEVIQSEHTPSFNMNVFDNDRAKASNAQSQINCLQLLEEQEQELYTQERGSLDTSKAFDVAGNNDKSQGKSFAWMQKDLNDLLSGLHKPQQPSTAVATQPSMSFSEPSLLSFSTSLNKNNDNNMNAISTEKEGNTLPSMLSISDKTNNNIVGANKLLPQHEQSHSQAWTSSTSSTQGSAISNTNDTTSNSNAQQQTSAAAAALRPPKLFTELPPGWQVMYSDKYNRHYFVSKDASGKNKVQWQHPLGPAAQQRFEKQLEQFKKEQLEYQSRRQQELEQKQKQQQISSTPNTSLPITPAPASATSSQQMQQQQEKESLPPNWECKVDPRVNRPFYINHVTHETTWIKPSAILPQNANSNNNINNIVLPPNWEAKVDPLSQRTFYINHLTRQSTWTPPTN